MIPTYDSPPFVEGIRQICEQEGVKLESTPRPHPGGGFEFRASGRAFWVLTWDMRDVQAIEAAVRTALVEGTLVDRYLARPTPRLGMGTRGYRRTSR